MVAMFLHVLAYDVKNRVIQREFVWSSETVSRHFNLVLLVVVRLYEELIKRPIPRVYFNLQNCIGVCDTKGDFVYVLVGWEGFAIDSRILRDVLARENGLQVPKGYYYLCDAGYPNAKGFLDPYRGQRYHLQEWRGAGNSPTNAKEYFNMKHSSTRNVIERAFGVLKGRWTILRGKSEMTYCNDVDEGDSAYATTIATKDIHYIKMTNEWSQWRDTLAESMFTDWHLLKGLLNKSFSYYDELTYVFGRDKAMGRFAKTFVDVGSNEPGGYEGFDMADGNEEFLPCTAKGLTCRRIMYAHHDLLVLQRVGPNRVDPRGRGEVSERWMLKAYI
ncbi:retrotransposon protein [Cucumis melo var. makuwa]|uniref:Retrotransposon protein n=1 Tax=Cucumis melo var. makuwa TaxID=1194695 RepID=A0A5A7U1U7_CUCMM|nr:retrotransposon protein [Cucumis melo var. makuwa]TYK08051.1 retrotransposon protein [Cucumis melo var. makuwa]